MNVNNKIKSLAEERGWSEYRLVKESGLASSTIANIYHRNTLPNIITLECLCATFGITLSQFFSEGEAIYLSNEQTELLDLWSKTTPAQQKALINLLKVLN